MKNDSDNDKRKQSVVANIKHSHAAAPLLKSAVLKQATLSLQSISRGADTDFDSHILPARPGFSRAKSRTKVQDDCIGEVDLQPSHSAVTSELVSEPVYNVSFFSRGLRRGPT
jgi:hypothetical protein